MNPSPRLAIALLCLRVSVFVVMLLWTVGKIVQPAHAMSIFAHFYNLRFQSSWPVYAAAALELIVLLAFVVGYRKQFSYAIVLVLHTVSTVASYRQYLSPFERENLLFFAALPMLAACLALYLLRDQDVLWALKPSARNLSGGAR